MIFPTQIDAEICLANVALMSILLFAIQHQQWPFCKFFRASGTLKFWFCRQLVRRIVTIETSQTQETQTTVNVVALIRIFVGVNDWVSAQLLFSVKCFLAHSARMSVESQVHVIVVSFSASLIAEIFVTRFMSAFNSFQDCVPIGFNFVDATYVSPQIGLCNVRFCTRRFGAIVFFD